MSTQISPLPSCGIRWKCPYLSCGEAFAHAWDRRNHLQDTHWKKEEKPPASTEADNEGIQVDIPQADNPGNPLESNPRFTNEDGHSATRPEFSIPSNATFELKVPIRTTFSTNSNCTTESGYSVSIDIQDTSEGKSSDPSEQRRPVQTYNMFDIGDFIAVLGSKEEGQVEFTVSSHALCISSPVWRILCSGAFKESFTKRVTFPDDDPDAMLMLFSIAHMRFADIPSELLGPSELYHLAVVCDKYDCALLLRPWARSWIEDVKSPPEGRRRYFSDTLMKIYWVFGDMKAFENRAKLLLMGTNCERDPQTLTSGRQMYDSTFEVPEIIESIIKTREQTITKLFGLCDTYTQELVGSSQCELCQGPLCNALNLGSLLQGLRNMGAWPNKPLEKYQSYTVRRLKNELLEIYFPETPAEKCSTPCPGKLGRDFKNRVNKICNDASPLLGRHNRHLKERNDKLRLFP